jgi:hypothetical protein
MVGSLPPPNGDNVATGSTKKLLVAVRPQDLKVVSEALGTEFELVFCHSLAEAKAALNAG